MKIQKLLNEITRYNIENAYGSGGDMWLEVEEEDREGEWVRFEELKELIGRVIKNGEDNIQQPTEG